ncbi:MAG: hypothetical protein M1358_13080 [Chloroflexi bacterium]|nr:hypothetical protein [Chloroflexota bacterium]
MVMDLISGIVVVSSVFLLSLALGALFLGMASRELVKSGKDGGLKNIDSLEWLVSSRSRVIFASLFIVYTVAMTDIFVIAQQPTLAFLNFAAGIALVGMQFVAVSKWNPVPKPADDSGRDDWKR